MNVPGDNVVTDAILQEGVDLNTKMMDLQCYHLILHCVGKHYYIKNIWRKKREEIKSSLIQCHRQIGAP